MSDNDIGAAGGDTVNGLDVTASWPGDEITIATASGNITYVGITFYTAGGGRFFTPTDGQLLQAGTFVNSDFVNTSTPLDVGDLGPSCFNPWYFGSPHQTAPWQSRRLRLEIMWIPWMTVRNLFE